MIFVGCSGFPKATEYNSRTPESHLELFQTKD